MKHVRWMLTFFGVLGAFMNAMGMWWCFVLWIGVNIGWITVNIRRREWPEAVLFSVYLVSAITGLLIWTNSL